MKCCIFLTIFFCLKFSCAASAVKQDTNVHDIAKTVTRELWAKLVTKQGSDLTFSVDKDSKFSVSFALAVADIKKIINRIEKSQPILQFLAIKDVGSVFSMVLADSDLDAAQTPQDWDKASAKNLRLAMKKMGVLGKHDNATDWDNEANIHANEVLVRVWREVRQNNELLQNFLTQLADAAPTCIQGHTVRLVEVVSSVVSSSREAPNIKKPSSAGGVDVQDKTNKASQAKPPVAQEEQKNETKSSDPPIKDTSGSN